jgi:hypothetical protein
MKNLLKVASAVALSCTFLAAHAQQGDGKMLKKDEKTPEGETVSKAKMHTGKVHDGKMATKTKMSKDGEMTTKEKM